MSARFDYAVRALVELAVANGVQRSRRELAEAQNIPGRYLEAVLSDLRRAGFVAAHRGPAGGYVLARSPAQINVAEVARAVDGPLTLVQGQRPENVTYSGSSRHVHELWIGLRAAMRAVLESVTLADLVEGRLPAEVRALIDDPDAWRPR